MKKFVTLILGSALTALIACPALADSTAPVEPKSAAAGATAAATSAPTAVPAAPAGAPATAAKPAPAAPAPTTIAAPEPTAPTRIGYVDMAQIASDTDSGKAASTALKAKSLKLSAKIEARQKQLEKQKAALDAKMESLSAKERAAKVKEFQKKVEEYQKMVRASDLEMQEMQEKLTSDIYKAIKKAATTYGKSHGYAAVLAKKDILYLADTPEPKDLTDDIAALLNQKTESK
jgi:outer membrane protein